MRRRLLPMLLAGLTLGLASCDGPSPGEVTLILRTPNADDGAISFAVTVPAPNEVTGATAACEGCDVFFTRVSSTELRGIVSGNVVAGPVVRVAILQGAPYEAYRLDVLEVANRQFDVIPATGYTLTAQR